MPNEYNYKVQERSLTQGFLTKYLWEPIVARLPRKWTPNSITVVGACFVFISPIFIWLGLQKGISLGYVLAALCIFIYMTCDNVDGPHARKTGQSSRLGEFLDHWLDAMDSVIMNLCIVAMLHLDGWLTMIGVALVALSFFATIWEHHHTGVFHSGRLGTNEALLLIIGFYLMMAIFAPARILEYQGPFVPNLASGMLYLTIIGCLITLGGILYRVREHWQEFLPILFVIVAVFVWYQCGLLANLLACFLLLSGNLLYCGKLLLGRLVQEQFPYRDKIVMIVALLAILVPSLSSWLPPLFYFIFLYTSMFGIAVLLIHDLSKALQKLH